jgi:hypothetical protein
LDWISRIEILALTITCNISSQSLKLSWNKIFLIKYKKAKNNSRKSTRSELQNAVTITEAENPSQPCLIFACSEVRDGETMKKEFAKPVLQISCQQNKKLCKTHFRSSRLSKTNPASLPSAADKKVNAIQFGQLCPL